jgi:hypothetical protein
VLITRYSSITSRLKHDLGAHGPLSFNRMSFHEIVMSEI